MKISCRNIYSILKKSLSKWWVKDPFRESAIIAYYSIFALPGLLVVIITSVGYFLGDEAINNHITAQFASTMGVDTAVQIQNIILQASEAKNSVMATIIGIVIMIVGATTVFAQFQKSLNIIWEVKVDESKYGIWSYVKIRLFSFGLIITMAFLLIVSLVFSALLSAFGNWLSGHFSESFFIALHVANFALSYVILTILFALMFKFLPDAKIKWNHVWIGSIVTSFLFNIGKFGLGLYFGKLNPGDGYGTAGSIILIMLWVSYSSMIVFFGAEFTRVYADFISGGVGPKEIAKSDIHVSNE
ncbi:YihY/virulence factor BrkB family protein [Lacihabitans sp. LS3-19]|uniref:YihY/virulence factor BrkB family protein n=1 Tax=Lacihabitans sp. LS3-19 TaxID=2487335 RepID=UPI0020CD7C6C|nr:YihY/virulence factor BrkB family protein [Lacihabitans sp. LS3-19]MCP9768380.1 YihY/virulence factor BrkB family protein [Lacihabitans sp. LS3-19]